MKSSNQFKGAVFAFALGLIACIAAAAFSCLQQIDISVIICELICVGCLAALFILHIADAREDAEEFENNIESHRRAIEDIDNAPKGYVAPKSEKKVRFFDSYDNKANTAAQTVKPVIPQVDSNASNITLEEKTVDEAEINPEENKDSHKIHFETNDNAVASKEPAESVVSVNAEKHEKKKIKWQDEAEDETVEEVSVQDNAISNSDDNTAVETVEEDNNAEQTETAVADVQEAAEPTDGPEEKSASIFDYINEIEAETSDEIVAEYEEEVAQATDSPADSEDDITADNDIFSVLNSDFDIKLEDEDLDVSLEETAAEIQIPEPVKRLPRKFYFKSLKKIPRTWEMPKKIKCGNKE